MLWRLVTLLALALVVPVQPALAQQDQPDARVILLLDNSVSMRDTDPGTERFSLSSPDGSPATAQTSRVGNTFIETVANPAPGVWRATAGAEPASLAMLLWPAGSDRGRRVMTAVQVEPEQPPEPVPAGAVIEPVVRPPTQAAGSGMPLAGLLTGLFLFGVVLVMAGLSLPLFGRDPVQARLARFADRPRTLEEMELEVPFSERVLRPMAQRLAGVMMRARRRRDVRQEERQANVVQRRLALAGNPHRWSPMDFLGLKGLMAAGLAGFLFLFLTILGQPAIAFIAAAVGGLIGFMLPEMYLNQLIGQRQHEIRKVLPDSIDLLVICVEAGLGFDAALARLCQKADNALTREFARGLQELRVGRPRREALKEVIARTEVPDLANFISAVIQADQLGVSVTQVLAVQADQMRTLRRQRAEEQAAQAPLKMLIPMMIFIFPALCVVILGPLWPQLTNVSTTAP